ADARGPMARLGRGRAWPSRSGYLRVVGARCRTPRTPGPAGPFTPSGAALLGGERLGPGALPLLLEASAGLVEVAGLGQQPLGQRPVPLDLLAQPVVDGAVGRLLDGPVVASSVVVRVVVVRVHVTPLPRTPGTSPGSGVVSATR